MPKLTVIVDGTPMPEEEARIFWTRFSDHMEANKGDLAGFAKAEGFASVRPAMGPEGAGQAQPKPTFQPVRANIFPADPIFTVRSRILGSDNRDT